VPGSIVWLTLAACTVVWLAILTFTSPGLIDARRLLRWLVASWLPRFVMLAAWAAAGWHIFCQRP
jgi:ammonia channel protein AmtB